MLVNHTNTNGVWSNSLAQRLPWLHASSVKNKTKNRKGLIPVYISTSTMHIRQGDSSIIQATAPVSFRIRHYVQPRTLLLLTIKRVNTQCH